MTSKDIIKAHGLYQCGMSLGKIAPRFNQTRQRLWHYFKVMNLKTRKKAVKESVVFNNLKYFKSQGEGCWRKSTGNRAMLHRDMWEFHNGPIPPGFDVHHKDENKDNNVIENFECLSKSEHTKQYCVFNNQYTKGKKVRTVNTPKQCPVCEKYFVKKMPSATISAITCSTKCATMWRSVPIGRSIMEVENAIF